MYTSLCDRLKIYVIACLGNFRRRSTPHDVEQQHKREERVRTDDSARGGALVRLSEPRECIRVLQTGFYVLQTGGDIQVSSLGWEHRLYLISSFVFLLLSS